ncbi:protein FAM53C [Protopterus annectens]|uniref:protein FAM53C n=1 Tax=Protopterus annectens TaxID=7888 RepID=UPI001CFBBAF4|nr:protein FAM53C [Protopterus annectens]
MQRKSILELAVHVSNAGESSWDVLKQSPDCDLQNALGCSTVHSSNRLNPAHLVLQSSPRTRTTLTPPARSELTDPCTSANVASLPAPPSKRHCRSLSVPEDLSRCRSTWRPCSSKIWTPVKRRCNSGGSAVGTQYPSSIQRSSTLRFPKDLSASFQCIQTSSPTFFSLALSPECHGSCTLSPNSGIWDSSDGPFQGTSFLSEEQVHFCSHRRFSLSPIHIKEPARSQQSASSTPSSTPELIRRQQGLLRSHSQPCDLNIRKCGARLKRRHDEDFRWNRPALDFYKMNQKRNTLTLCCLEADCYRESVEEQIKSCPYFRTGCSSHATQTLSPGPLPTEQYCPSTSNIQIPSESEDEDEDLKINCASFAGSGVVFQRDCADLDLALIEEN